jgi:four helix bundle protein
VPANIVEGFASRYRRARLHFLNISEGSLAEVGYCLHVAHRLGYVGDDQLAELERDLNGVGAPLAGLVRSTKADLTLSTLLIAIALVTAYWIAA